ncbi:MAG: hypothetical protein OER56_08615, partial [Hyphomicrobiales bacterium]|nr:hypothetical protein [Hyphomicrobiales bacterium]
MAIDPRKAALRLPDRAVVHAFVKFQLIFYLLFVPVYFGGKVVAEGSAGRRQLFAAWELNIPYQPLMFVPYGLFLFLFLLPMLHFQPRHFRALTLQTAAVLAVAALAFFLFPVQVAFPPVDMSALAPPFSHFVEFAFTRYNAVPSLHVAFTLL